MATYDQVVGGLPGGGRMSPIAKPYDPPDAPDKPDPRSPRSQVGERATDTLKELAAEGRRRPRPRRRKKGPGPEAPRERSGSASRLDTLRLDEFEKRRLDDFERRAAVEAEVIAGRRLPEVEEPQSDWLFSYLGCSVGCTGVAYPQLTSTRAIASSRSGSWDGTDLDPESDEEVITDVELFVVAHRDRPPPPPRRKGAPPPTASSSDDDGPPGAAPPEPDASLEAARAAHRALAAAKATDDLFSG